MTEKQQKQVTIQKAVMNVMEKNTTKWQAITELKSKYDRFIRNMKKIEDYNSMLKTDLALLKEKKNKSKKELVEQVFPVTSVLGVYAFDMGDRKLGKFVNIKFGDLENMNVDSLEKYCIKVLKISRSLLDQKVEAEKKAPKHVIADYGLTASHLDNFQASLDLNIRNEADFRDTRIQKKKSKVKRERSIRENNGLLKKKIDRMMHLFRDSQKTFYSAYIKARIPAESEPAVPATQSAPEKTVAAAKKPATAAKKPATAAKKPVTTAKKPAAATTKPPAASGSGL